MNLSKMIALLILVTIIVGILAIPSLLDSDDDDEITPTVELPENYIIIVQEPESEEERAMVAALSVLAVHDGEFHPMFLLEEGILDDHALHTIENSNYVDATKFLFTNDPAMVSEISDQVSNVIEKPFTTKEFNREMQSYIGYNGKISVGSYEEAMWVAPLANFENKVIVLGKPTYHAQEEVWDELYANGVTGRYIIITNPDDWMGQERFFTVYESHNSTYHIPSLSLVAAELAAYHQAYVLTDINVKTQFPSEYDGLIPSDDPHVNDEAISTLVMLRNINIQYGGIEYICPVGSAEAVPQFDLEDHSGSEPDYTSSDVVYGFLDADPYTMDAGFGRIVNYNAQGAFNMVARTWGYDQLQEEVTVTTDEGTRTENWKTHGSSWNGYEVADIRLQNTPGVLFQQDLEDEGFTCDYYSTLGPGATGEGIPASNIRAGLEVSGLVAYRGHGSWHGSIYQWGYFMYAGTGIIGYGDDERGHLEGTVARTFFYPPQIGMIVSCENTKIHGLSYGGDPIEMDRAFATNYLYGGAVGLCGATEVSYSNIGQDGYTLVSPVTGDAEWQNNDLWYAAFWDNMLDGAFENGEHIGPEPTAGNALMYAENRYMFDNPGHSPLLQEGDGVHWKEVAMFTYYGDPAFHPYHMIEGPNNFDPWH